jgi:hypothetical protein
LAVHALSSLLRRRLSSDKWGALRRGLGRSFLFSPLVVLGLITLYFVVIGNAWWWGLFGLLSFAFSLLTVAAFLSMPFIVPGSMMVDSRGLSQARIVAAASLRRLRRPESVPALAFACHDGNYEVASRSMEALLEILPALTPAHYGALNSDTVPNLCDAMRHWGSPRDMIFLDALEKIGDGRAIPAVEEMLKQAQSKEQNARAEAVLQVLRERDRQAKDPRRLLRPMPQPADSDLLVRPAASDFAESDRLLRPQSLQE